MELAHVQTMMKKHLKEITTLEALLHSPLVVKRSIFELQLLMGSISNSKELTQTFTLLPCEHGSSLETRFQLVQALLSLQSHIPERFETHMANFVGLLHTEIKALPSKTKSKQSLKTMLFHIETELALHACVLFFQHNEHGSDLDQDNDPQYQIAMSRYRHAVLRILPPLKVKISSSLDEEEVLFRNVRVDNAMNICPNPNVFFQYNMNTLLESVNPELIFQCCRQLVGEIQFLRFGNPVADLLPPPVSLPHKAVSAPPLAVAASIASEVFPATQFESSPQFSVHSSPSSPHRSSSSSSVEEMFREEDEVAVVVVPTTITTTTPFGKLPTPVKSPLVSAASKSESVFSTPKLDSSAALSAHSSHKSQERRVGEEAEKPTTMAATLSEPRSTEARSKPSPVNEVAAAESSTFVSKLNISPSPTVVVTAAQQPLPQPPPRLPLFFVSLGPVPGPFPDNFPKPTSPERTNTVEQEFKRSRVEVEEKQESDVHLLAVDVPAAAAAAELDAMPDHHDVLPSPPVEAEEEEEEEMWKQQAKMRHSESLRVRFTKEEDDALRAGVQKHGLGKWKKILFDPDFFMIFTSVKERTPVNLKDRWRNL